MRARTRSRRDEAFERKMAEVLCVYREVAVLRENESVQPNLAIISYDEKPGIQAIAGTAPDLRPQPGFHAGWARDHEYKRHGTLSPARGDRPAHGQGSRLCRKSPSLTGVHRFSQET